ncbi:unannotated protein [freshwater metagenome]|uniref:Unannotated protein n=1 Tax=freshwater metagenome TaxID=449393 RepID=A0A6J7EV12_9ZZZZ
MGRRQHDADIGAESVGEVSHGRCGNNAQKGDVDASARKPSDDCRLKELTARPAITADERGWSMSRECAHVREDVGSSHGKIKSKLGREIAIREPADSVGTE